MESPPQGASHTSGGVLRGKAQGKMFSHSDAPEMLSGIVKPVKGDVKIATSLSNPLVKFTVKTNCDTSLLQVLMQMKKRHTSMEGKLSDFTSICGSDCLIKFRCKNLYHAEWQLVCKG